VSNLDLRVSDADRERTAARLRDAAGEGRLDVAELDERLERAYAARTRADLDGLTDDLPRRRRERRTAHHRPEVRVYLMVMTLLVAIWALTGAGYFWPVWPALGWGFGLFVGGSVCSRADKRLV
jgi:Domain of unknown function (DUF1707)/2TM domain